MRWFECSDRPNVVRSVSANVRNLIDELDADLIGFDDRHAERDDHKDRYGDRLPIKIIIKLVTKNIDSVDRHDDGVDENRHDHGDTLDSDHEDAASSAWSILSLESSAWSIVSLAQSQPACLRTLSTALFEC